MIYYNIKKREKEKSPKSSQLLAVLWLGTKERKGIRSAVG
jgi:hypothetical protein